MWKDFIIKKYTRIKINHQHNFFDIEILLKGCVMYYFTESETDSASKKSEDSEDEIGNINKQ